jgi:hypothetical protein
MTRWRRPYEATGDMALGVVMICLSALVGAVFTFVLVGNFVWDFGIKLTDLAAPYAAVAICAVVGASNYRVGLYHNDHGVRLQYLIRSRVVPWSSIAAIESRPIPLASRREVRVIVLTTVAGAQIVTPVGCVSGGFAGNRRGNRFSQAAGRNLSPGDYTRALGILQRGLIAAQRRTDPTVNPPIGT